MNGPANMNGMAPDPVDREAVAWFVRLRDEDATAEDRVRFAAWLAADARHRAAWREVEGLWSGLDGIGSHAGDVVSLTEGRMRAGVSQPHWPTWQRFATVAAVLLVLAGVVTVWAVQAPGFTAGLLADLRTGIGEQRTAALPDGTTATLGADSALSVDFGARVRRVTLHHGEAFFAVAKDVRRPFVVEAADGRITALGTAFDVKLDDGAVGIAVAEGIVEVTVASGASVRLSSGQSLRYDGSGMEAPETIDTADIGFWRNERLIFRRAPLASVFRDLERYRRGRILVTDERLAGLPVTGVFDVRRPDAALDTIARTLPVQLVRVTGLLVLVRPAD